MGQCCSDTFAGALASELGLGHKACPFGSFTDSANYTDFIPECTNVSVGYQKEHSSAETLDTDYLETLIESLIRADLDSLPVVRECWENDDYRESLREPLRHAYTWENVARRFGSKDVLDGNLRLARSYLDKYVDDTDCLVQMCHDCHELNGEHKAWCFQDTDLLRNRFA